MGGGVGGGVNGGVNGGGASASLTLSALVGGSVVLMDFSNAMALGETEAYHDDFEVTTLAYRAPELLCTRRDARAHTHK